MANEQNMANGLNNSQFEAIGKTKPALYCLVAQPKPRQALTTFIQIDHLY
jgi:hypothetical protein